ncbi:MAG: BatD family protein [Bacteroides sp.]
MRKLIFLFILLIAGLNAKADERASFTASAPDAVVTGEQFRLTYTVTTQKIKDFRAPSIKGFEVLMGPSRSQQSSTQIINGNISSSSTITFTYILLAENEGTFTIPAASIVADGNAMNSNVLRIKVLPPDKTGSNNSDEESSSSRSQSSGTKVSNQDIFMLVTASKSSVYEQEALLLTYKLYTAVSFQGFNNVKMPDFKGFHSQEIKISQKQEASMEHYKGRNYRTAICAQYVLFPQQTGKLEIPSAQFDASVAKAVRSADPFDAFFNGGNNYVEVKKALITPKITINVNPLPAGKPASFSGGVGEFTLSSSINTKELKTNDAVTIKLIISGTGNLKLINTPEIAFPKDFEMYDPKIDNKFSTTRNGLSGSKVIEYLAIPRHPGTFNIPAVEFSYFDLKTKSYKTLKTENYEIKVEKGAGNADQMIADFTNKEDLKMIGQDIRYIKSGNSTLRPKGDFLFGSFIYYLWYIIPLCFFIALVIIYRKKVIENANVAKVRTKKANKVAAKRMKTAEKFLKENKKAEFYDEILKALWGYISDKLNIPVSQLSKDNIEYELAKYGVSVELTKEFIDALNQCEFARYAPGDENEAMDKVYSSSMEVISKMENIIKH